jgi:hypothetical protein
MQFSCSHICHTAKMLHSYSFEDRVITTIHQSHKSLVNIDFPTRENVIILMKSEKKNTMGFPVHSYELLSLFEPQNLMIRKNLRYFLIFPLSKCINLLLHYTHTSGLCISTVIRYSQLKRLNSTCIK